MLVDQLPYTPPGAEDFKVIPEASSVCELNDLPPVDPVKNSPPGNQTPTKVFLGPYWSGGTVRRIHR